MNFGNVSQKIDFKMDRSKKLYLPDTKVRCQIDAINYDHAGNIRWAELGRVNGVVNDGFNLMLNSMFRNGTDTLYSSWYIGLISNASYSALNVSDTMASHSGWTEDSTHYSGSNRPQWSPAAASGKSLSNTSSVNFSITTDNTIIKGIFVATDNTLGGTAGLLWATGLFSGDQTLYNGDTLKITYTVTLS